MSSSRATATPLQPSCLYPDEAEIARLILGPKRARAWSGLAVVLERSGLPKVNPMMGGRYWPAVREFLDRYNHTGEYASGRHLTRYEGRADARGASKQGAR